MTRPKPATDDQAAGSGVLVCDIDGTLTAPGATTVPADVVRSLAPFARDGRLILATGRHPRSVRQLFEPIGFVPTISLGGSAVHLDGWASPSFTIPVPDRLAFGIADLCLERYEQVVLFTADCAYSPKPELIDDALCALLGCLPLELSSADPHLPFLKILVIDPTFQPGNFGQLAKALSAVAVGVSCSVPGFLDICAAGVDKAALLPMCLERMRGATRDRAYIVFIGDSSNDICCAAAADQSWAFSSSPGRLKQLASGLLPDNSAAELVDVLAAIRCSPHFRQSP